MFILGICFHLLWFPAFANLTWHPPLLFNYEPSKVHRAGYRLKMKALTKVHHFVPFQYVEKLQIMNKLSDNLQSVLESCFYFIQDEDYLFENKTLLQETILSCAIRHLSQLTSHLTKTCYLLTTQVVEITNIYLHTFLTNILKK